MAESREVEQTKKATLRLAAQACALLSAARDQDPARARREARGTALKLAEVCRLVGEIELAGALERVLFRTAGFSAD